MKIEALSIAREKKEATLEHALLPHGWRWARLGELCIGSGQYGTSEKADATLSTGIPVLGMSNIFEGRLKWDNLRFINLPPAESDKYRLKKGDVLFNRTNSAELVGKTAVFDGSHDAVFASYLIRLRVSEAMANPHFIAAYINSAGGRRFIEANMARAIGQVNISASTLMTMPVPIAPLSEQHRIAAILKEQMAAVERARAAAEAQLKAAKGLPAAHLREIFENLEARQWQRKQLADVCRISTGTTPSRSVAEYFGHGTSWVTPGDFDGSIYIREGRESVTPFAIECGRARVFPPKTVLLVCIGATIGKVAIAADYISANQQINSLQCNDLLCPEFLYFYLRYDRAEFVAAAASVTLPIINQERLGAREIPLPLVAEQEQIVKQLKEKIEGADRIAALLQNQLDTINQIPAAVLRQAFSGRL